MQSAPAASGDRPEQGIPSLELWKAQLGYVSGTILAWGAVLLQLWPVLARLQTGAHVHALGRDEGGDVTAMSYYLLALLVAVGLGMLIFGAAHVLARGFWLTGFLIERPSPTTLLASDRTARDTYVVLHVFWATSLLVVCLVPLSALSALLTTLFTSTFGWPPVLARVLASLLAFAPLYAAAIVLYRRRRSQGRRERVGIGRRIGYRNIALAYVSLPLLWVVVIEFSYVADLRLERHVFSRSADAQIVVSVELAGAVSNPSPARVALIGTMTGGRLSEPLRLRHVGNGVHVSILPTKSLQSGDYDVALTYPHPALSPTFPFLRRRIVRRVGFVVVD